MDITLWITFWVGRYTDVVWPAKYDRGRIKFPTYNEANLVKFLSNTSELFVVFVSLVLFPINGDYPAPSVCPDNIPLFSNANAGPRTNEAKPTSLVHLEYEKNRLPKGNF